MSCPRMPVLPYSLFYNSFIALLFKKTPPKKYEIAVKGIIAHLFICRSWLI